MAFVIPSKHIYNKDNDKLRDNKIDRIEVGAFEVVPNNEYETPVYNQQYTESGVWGTKNIDLQGNIYHLTGGAYSASACYVSLTPSYSNNIEIYIPIVSNNKYIDTLLLGIDKNGNENIKLRVVGDIIKRNATAKMDYSGGTSNMKISDISYSDEEIISSNKTINISALKENYDLEYTFDFNATSSHIIAEVDINQKELSINATHSWNATATASLKIDSLSNIYSIEKSPITTINGVKCYKLELKVLCGVEYDILAGNGSYYRDETHGSEIWTMKGINYKYMPKQIEITVYGNTIGIDLTDKTIYVPNQSGNKPFFVEGNELMQKSNVCLDSSNLLVEYKDSNKAVIKFKDGISKSKNTYVTINIHNILNGEDYIRVKGRQEIIRAGETQTRDLSLITDEWIEITSAYTEDQISESFSKTLLSYSQGKETATIRCAIADYINYISATVVEYAPIEDDNEVFCILDVKKSYLAKKIVQADYIEVQGVIGKVWEAIDTKVHIDFYSLSIVPYLEKGTLTIPLKEIDINNKNGKMAFDIYDEVIPMVYTANQTDKPMSRYKDGSAKTFVVLGTKIYFDGAVWQELTLQEK